MSNAATATATREVVTESSQYKYGALGGTYSESTIGVPPMMNPKIGKLFYPDESERWYDYPTLASKLGKAIRAAVPEGTGPILNLQLRSASHAVDTAYNCLSCDAYVLGEVDPEHPLLKVATSSSMVEFRAGVRLWCN